MMCANNIMSTVITLSYLGLSPYLVHTGIGDYLGMDLGGKGGGEFWDALAFMGRHPGVWRDVVGFAVCGAVGQVFICKLSVFPSLFSLLGRKRNSDTRDSLHARNILLPPLSNHNCDPQNAHHDPVRNMVWTQLRRQAMVGCRISIWWDWS